MTTSGSDPNNKPGDERDESGSSSTSGWQYPATGPSGPEPSGSSQPTGWERPNSESDPGASPSSSPPVGSSADSPPSQPPAPPPETGPDWPSYPSSEGELTRPLPPDQPYGVAPSSAQSGDQPTYQAPYQPYDPQSMPGYGSSTSYPSADAPQAGYPTSAPSTGGYANNPYEVNPYQQGQYGGYVGYGPPPNHPQAVTALVLGLVGLVVCTPVGIGGLVLGSRVRREIDAAPGQYSGRGLATAGWVMGIISVVLLVVIVVLAIIGFTAGALGN